MPNRPNFREVFHNYKSDEQKSLNFREKFPNYSIGAPNIASLGASFVMLRTKKGAVPKAMMVAWGGLFFCEKKSLFLMLECYRSVVENRVSLHSPY